MITNTKHSNVKVDDENPDNEGVQFQMKRKQLLVFCLTKLQNTPLIFASNIEQVTNHETQLQTRKLRTHEQRLAITFMGLRKRVRMEDCLVGPHLGNHETQLKTRKWRTHEQP